MGQMKIQQEIIKKVNAYIVNWKLQQWGVASGLVSAIDDPEEN